MDLLIAALQCLIAGAMFDVWLIRYNKRGLVRGGNATTMPEEFRVYGLPDWFRDTIRALKLSARSLMLAGLWIPELAILAGYGLAILMVGAVVMHVRVKDPVYKSIPAALFGGISLPIAIYHSGLGE